MTDQEKTAQSETAPASEAAKPTENCESGACEAPAPEAKREENPTPGEE